MKYQTNKSYTYKNSIPFSSVGIAGTILLAIQLIFGGFQISREYNQQVEELHNKAKLQAQSLRVFSQEAMSQSDLVAVENLIQKIGVDDDIACLVIFNSNESPVSQFVNQNNSIIAAAISSKNFQLDAVNLIRKIRSHPDVQEVRVPLVYQRVFVGELRMLYSISKAKERIFISAFTLAVESIVVSCTLALVAVFMFQRQIRKPLQDLTDLAQTLMAVVETQNFDCLHTHRGINCDEIGQLKSTFNSMVSHLHETVLNLEKRVAERQRTEEALQQSYNLLQAVIEGTTDPIYVKNLQGRYILINSAVARVLGRGREEIIGKDDSELLSPETARQIMVTDRKIMLRGQTKTVEEVVTSLHDGELEDISESRIYLTKKDVYRDPEGNVIGLICVARDITDRKLAEEALRESANQLKTQATQLEKTLQQLQRTQAQLVQSEKMSSLGQLVAGIAHEINNPVNFIYGNLDHTQTYLFDLLKLVHLYQKHYPKPVPEIQAELEEIEVDFVAEDLPRIIDSMKNGAQRISQIVLSLRNFSRLDESEAKNVDLHQGINSTLLILNNRLKEKISVIKNYADLPLLECQPAPLNQVFMNILNNAIDALEEQSKPGIITITTEIDFVESPTENNLLETEANHSFVLIRISDNGPGIPPAIQKKIFDPFFTTKPVGKGTGLGLSICHQIVAKHGGSIWVHSQLGEGTEFVISLPFKKFVVPCLLGAYN